MLVDARHGLKESDKELLHFLQRWNVSWQILLTKADLLKPKDLIKTVMIVSSCNRKKKKSKRKKRRQRMERMEVFSGGVLQSRHGGARGSGRERRSGWRV